MAELLIALAILGVIATFTIPKILSAQQSQKYNAIEKETASMISAAYQQAQQAGTVTSNTKPADLIPYMNYVKLETGGASVDNRQTLGKIDCSPTYPCLTLHNGAKIIFYVESFGGTNSTNALSFWVDPDGIVTNGGSGDTSAAAPGKSVNFILHYSGRLTTIAKTSTFCDSLGCWGAAPTNDPPWFSW